MRNLFLLFFIFVAAINVNGQNHFIGVKGGLSWTTARGYSEDYKDDFRTKLTMGFTYDYFLKKHFSIGADLLYDQRGFAYADSPLTYGDLFDQDFGRKLLRMRNYNYISVPLKAGFNYGEKVFGFANICLVPSWLVYAENRSLILNPDGFISSSRTSSITENAKKFDLGGLIEIGGGYKFGRYWLYSSASYQHSFINIENYNIPGNPTLLHGFKLNLGLKYALKPE